MIKIFSWFKKKPIVKELEILDKHSEDGYALDVAILKVMALAKEYGPPGMVEMTKEISRQVGENILQSGLSNEKIKRLLSNKWQVESPHTRDEMKKYAKEIMEEIDDGAL